MAIITDADFKADVLRRSLLNDWRSGLDVTKVTNEVLAAPNKQIVNKHSIMGRK